MDTMYVLVRDDGKFLGRGGKSLSYEVQDDVTAASPFVKEDEAYLEAYRAKEILGMDFRVESRHVSQLVKEKAGR